jgi:glutathione peroxidase
MTEKIEVNAPGRHAVYAGLVGDGEDIAWNFEKFLVDGSGSVVARFSPQVEPEDPRLREAIDTLV